MRFSLRWLRQYLNSELTPDQIIQTLTMSGLEVEEAFDLGMGSGKIVVAEILEAVPHPDADRLRLCKVEAGVGRVLDIVCGAPNAAAGLRVPCAMEGAVLPNGLVIKKSKIRGQASEGMLCAADELGLGNDHAGILELPDTYKVGEPFDYVIDIKVTPNRPDCLSILGVARDLAAMIGKKVFPPTPRFKETLDHIEGYMRLTVKARSECPRYTCRLIRGVRVEATPLWMRRTLEASGLRTINNVVDVTNYVLYELGHPLHAFDFDLLEGNEIIVRMAEPGEKLMLINGQELELCAEDLVIADSRRPIALAGIMGGRDTEVTDKTTNVLLESAYFDPVTVRKTARRYGLSTDASYRFERGTDRQRVTLSLGRATQLIQEIAGGENAKGLLDQHASMTDPGPIVLEIERLHKLLGVALSSTEIADRLVNLGFEIRRSEKTALMVVPPSHRVDISRDVDLIEEVARLYGYDNIPSTLPRVTAVEVPTEPIAALLNDGSDAMAALGFHEAVNYAFIAEESAGALGYDAATLPHLANPLTPEQAIMRPSLLPGLLRNLGHNQKQGEPSVALFEVGKVWTREAGPGKLEGERQELAAVLAGPLPTNWTAPARAADFYDIKGVAESLLTDLGAAARYAPLTDNTSLHPGRAAAITLGGETIGEVGELHPDAAEHFDLRGRVYVLRLDLTALARLLKPQFAIKPLPRFPASERDLALVLDRTVPAQQLLDLTRGAARELLEDVSVFDLYEGEHVPAGKKSVALRLRLRAANETLTDEQIASTLERVVQKLASTTGAVLRA